MKTDDELDVKGSTVVSERMVSVIEAPDYLANFNIDTGGEAEESSMPHYIVNLNSKHSFFNEIISQVYNTNTDMDALTTLPIHGQDPGIGESSVSLPTSDMNSPVIMNDNVGLMCGVNSTGRGQQFFTPTMRSKARGRGRFSSVPLDDVMEKKIRTYEGKDCVQELGKLLKLFPRFKRAYINRVFTRNMLSYEKSYEQLKEEDDRERERCSKVRLIQAPKAESKRPTDSKTHNRPELPLQSQAFLCMGLPLGRCPPHVANSLYRRVIVTPEGTVESADEHEQKFLDSTGLSSSALETPSSHCEPPRPKPSLFTGDNNAETLNSEETTIQQSGNKFFRTDHVSEAQKKKRGYINREMRTATVSTPVSRTSITASAVKSDLDSDDSSRKPGDAVKYLAKVGVVSNSVNRKRPTRRGKSTRQKSTTEIQGVNNETTTSPAVEVITEDDGLDLTNEERRHLLSFFNDAVLEELTLMPGCSRKTAQAIINMRPFKNTKDLVSQLSGVRHLSSNLYECCKDILEVRSAVIRLLNKCERLTEQVASHATRLLENTIDLPENAITDQNQSDGVDHEHDDFTINKANGNPVQLVTQQPAILNPLRELKPYQLVGLNWLRLLHHEQVNGILADEMGLGKTVQAIAFLASLWESGNRGPHLIICPSSTQDNWQRELSLWCPHLKVLVYQGSAEQRKAIRLKIYESESQPDFNILLTSYAVGTSAIEDRALMKRINFHYGIFDEAHMLKNMTSQRYRNLMNFRVQRRLLLTDEKDYPLGTSLITFSSNLLSDVNCMKPMNSREEDQSANNTPIRSSFEEERLVQAKSLLQPFCLRRLKSQVLGQLPPKTSEVVLVAMTKTQATHYHDLVKRLRSQRSLKDTNSNGQDPSLLLNNECEDGDENADPDASDPKGECAPRKKARLDNYTTVNGTKSFPVTSKSISESLQSPCNMVTALRKAANHQALFSGLAYTDSNLRDIAESLHLDPSHSNADPNLIYEDLLAMSDHQIHKLCQFYEVLSPYTLSPESIISGSGKIQWLNDNLPKLVSEGHRILIFSQFVIMLDILEEFLRITNRRYIRMDGSTPVSERQTLIDRFNSSSIEVFLLSTRAGGLGINLTGADTVIIHDIDFNPYNDRQAEDRCHRLGQKNPVHVIRLISEGTLEEGMLRIASEKLQMEQNVTGCVSEHNTEQTEESEDTTRVSSRSRRSKSTNILPCSSLDGMTENENVFKVLGNWNSAASDLSLSIVNPISSNRISERDVRSLLSDALKL
ncbi:SWI/SNF-related matrix-associated actin-dependent regulator of chromatin subfamily A [Schistosoma bovis]|uniref:SWI/SNF-related matrix-associated actin-dependent regulator of chromatin subfamily A n=1 Tax=Schistosoma bovis TaxID=6184 RepID=A0A430QS54_SCHBO|nr:SWI/SNF-related matrix-associated actin-dependent regulator of chromatin subfamily A [Schistosoma bovis]